MGLFSELFIWWKGQTLGTRILTWLRGKRVGTDSLGNTYYRDRRDRRWVIYGGVAEASWVPAEWHGWLHHITDEVPSPESQVRPWEQPHRPNQTGGPCAYRPPGSTLAAGHRPPATGDYEAWVPAGDAASR